MRIEKEFEKSGFFWLPGGEANKLAGTVRVKNGGRIELDIIGNFDEDLTLLNKNWNIPRILGFIDGEGNVTLEECVYTKKGLPVGGLSKSSIRASMMLCGANWSKEGEIITLSTFSFSVDCLDEWLGITGIKVEKDFKNPRFTIDFAPPKEICISLGNGFELKICFGWQFSGRPVLKEAKVSQHAYFKLTSPQERPLIEFNELAFKITNLLCLAVDETVARKNFCGTSEHITRDNHNGEKKPVPIKIYFESNPYTECEPQKSFHDMLFTYQAIKHDPAQIFNKWLESYEVFAPAISLYLAVKAGAYEYIDGKFLALAQGLETYHRRTSDVTLMEEEEYKQLVCEILSGCPEDHKNWLDGKLTYGNELTLYKRLQKIISPFKGYFGNEPERKKLLKKIVDTRNYLTHYAPDLESEAATGRELYVLCSKMEGMLILNFFAKLGFSEVLTTNLMENKSSVIARKIYPF